MATVAEELWKLQKQQVAKQNTPFAGSATGVNVNTSTQQSIKDRMNANSQAWHTAAPDERVRLENENKGLAAQLNQNGGNVAFDAKTGTWGGTAGQNTSPTLTTYVNDHSAYLNDLYKAQKDSAIADINNAYEKNVNAIDRAEVGLKEAYQNARNQTAGASDLAARNFNEYAAAAGLNTGTGGQATLARNVALQNNLNTINTTEAQSVADLKLQRANAETEYNNAIAKAEAEGNYQLAAALYQEKVRVDEAFTSALVQQYQNDMALYQTNMSNQQWQQQFDAGQRQNAQSQLAEYGNAFMQQGIMPSAQMLAAMGITQADAQSFINAVQVANAQKAAGRPSGGSSGNGVDWSTVEAWQKQYGDDAVENYIRENYKALGYSNVSTALAGWKNHLLTMAPVEAPMTGLSAKDGNVGPSTLSWAQKVLAARNNDMDYLVAAMRNRGFSDEDIDNVLYQLER